MEALRIKYSMLKDAAGSAEKAAKKFEKRMDDYEGVIKQLNKIPDGNRHNISSSITSIRRKNSSLEEKANALRAFAQRCDDYAETAKDADRRVANRINNSTDSFKKENKIKVSIFDNVKAGIEMWIRNKFGRWGNFGDSLYADMSKKTRDIKNNIRTWYEDEGGKYLVEIGKDLFFLALAAVSLALAPVTALGVFFGVFAIYKSFCDFGFDTAAYVFKDNRAAAERLSDMGGREVAVEGAGEFAENISGDAKAGNTVRDIANAAYSGLELADMVYSSWQFGKGIHKGWKSFKSMSGDNFNIKDFKTNLKNFKDFDKKTVFFEGITKPSKGAKPSKIVNYINNLSNKKYKSFAMDAYIFSDGIKKGKKIKKIFTKPFDIYESHGDGYYNIQRRKLTVNKHFRVNANYSNLIANKSFNKIVSFNKRFDSYRPIIRGYAYAN